MALGVSVMLFSGCANWLNDKFGLENAVTGSNGTITWKYYPNTNKIQIDGTADASTPFTASMITSTNIDITEVKTVEFSSGITALGDEALCAFTNMTKLIIPETMTSVGSSILSGLTKLTEFNITADISKWGTSWISGFTNVGWASYTNAAGEKVLEFFGSGGIQCTEVGWGTTDVTKIIIDQGITSLNYLNYGAFESMTSVKTIVFPATVVSIYDYAFKNCASLESLTIPSTVTSVSQSAFYGCPSDAKITLDWTSSDASHIVNPDGKYIGPPLYYNNGDGAFGGVKIENNTMVIYGKGFAYMPSEITSSDSIIYSIEIESGITYVERYGYVSNETYTHVTNISLPDTLSTINYCAFSDCKIVSSIIIPSSVTYIGTEAFQNCTNISSITIPKSVNFIIGNPFDNWTSSQTINLGWNSTESTSKNTPGLSITKANVYYSDSTAYK
jgi:hypothetical protein